MFALIRVSFKSDIVSSNVGITSVLLIPPTLKLAPVPPPPVIDITEPNVKPLPPSTSVGIILESSTVNTVPLAPVPDVATYDT